MDRLVAKEMRRKKASPHEPRSQIQAEICATFPKALGFSSSSKKGLQPPAIINYWSKFLI
jgi:hypothetical protein